MNRATINGVELEYEVSGRGEPLVLVHGGLLSEENTPLAREPGLTDHFTVVNYHRRGFGGSGHPTTKATIGDQAADLLGLVRHLGFDRVHVAGHSLGGAIAIQAALDAPAVVRSLVLLEPALMGAIAKAEAAGRPDAAAAQAEFMAGVNRVMDTYNSGDVRGALLQFLQSRAGEAFSGVFEWLSASGELEQAIIDAPTFLEVELPAAFQWSFTPARAATLDQPVLSMLGRHSPERPQKVHRVLTEWVPQTELFTLPDAEHALPLMDPPGIAATIATFLLRHPLPTGPLPVAAPQPAIDARQLLLPPGRRAPELNTIEAVRTKRRVSPSSREQDATVVIFHGRNTVTAANAVEAAVRNAHPSAGDVLVARVVDVRQVPRIVRKLAQRAMVDGFESAVKALPTGATPADVVILPDWDGAVIDAYGAADPDERVAVAVVDHSGDLRCLYDGDQPADAAVGLLTLLRAG